MGWRSHYAVSHFPGLVAFRPGRWLSPIKNSTHPLVDFGSPTESHPVGPSRPYRRSGARDPSPGLLLPSTLAGVRGPLCAGLPHPLRSVSRVWLPSGRFTPPGAWSGLFRPDGVPGISPFGAVPPHEVATAFPQRRTRLPSARHVLPRTKSWGRCGGHRFPGFGPLEDPS
jgi:hypothetical protein